MGRIKIFRNIFRVRGFRESLKFAVKGIIYLFLYHRNMRIIFTIGILVFVLGLYFRLEGIALVALGVTITTVFMAEMFNTAIEILMDMFTDKYSIIIKLVKDIAAAVVLLACLNAIGVGGILFFKKIFG